MSVRWITWAWEQKLPPTEKLTLVALADHAGEDGVCWPSSGRLQEKTGQGRSTVLRHLAALEAQGYIRREHRFREDGSQTSSLLILGGPESVREGDPNRDGGGSRNERAEPSDMNRQEEPSLLVLDDGFELFWATYRRTGSKKVARECWRKAIKLTRGDPTPIQTGLEQWMTYWDSPGAAKMKWPQGWLNEERWKNPPPAVSNAKTAPGMNAVRRVIEQERASHEA